MKLNVWETQLAIKSIKTTFEKYLSTNLKLTRVSAPKFVRTNTGIQDDLANTCESVKFRIPSCNFDVEIVHSLAKWKRVALGKYEVEVHSGIYTDMDAIRKDEQLDFMHSAYVDQWDWEVTIQQSDRNEHFLIDIVEKIYNAMKITEKYVHEQYHNRINILPQHIHFIHSEELVQMYPELTPKERENKIAKKYGAVFLIGIGYPLKNGKPHDIRAVDYDDWSTPNSIYHGLNGDIIVWNEVTQCAFELSSMGIRVDEQALTTQANIMKKQINADYHRMVINNSIPLSIGGGIGQSRLCMFLLDKHHIGEVQVSEWSDDVTRECRENGIQLL
jgi:aspartate--ammonia ligase